MSKNNNLKETNEEIMIKSKDILYLTSNDISDNKTIKLKNINNFCIFKFISQAEKEERYFFQSKQRK